MKIFNTGKFCEELLRLRGNETQQRFAEKLETNRSTLSLLETGKQLPSLEFLNKLCENTGKNPGDFFVESKNDALIYLMGSMSENDKEKISVMMEKIKAREKYEALAKRSKNDIRRQ